MAENNKNYDLNNFEEPTRIYGKHVREEDDTVSGTTREFIVDDTAKTVDLPNPPIAEYGDDFYSDGSNFEGSDEDDADAVFSPYNGYADAKSYSDRKSNNKNNNEDKKKNAIIIALVITLAVVVFVFSLVLFLGSSKNDDNKETKATVTASESVAPSETTEPTQAETKEEETDAPTQAEETQAPTLAPVTEAPVTEAPVVETTAEEIPQETPTESLDTEIEY